MRCSRRPENGAWMARGSSFDAGAFTKVGGDWRSPPGAPSGMVGVGKIGRRKVRRKISPAVSGF